jgi:hypothetical protein
MPTWLESQIDWLQGLKGADTWADFMQIVGVPLAIAALGLGWYQLRKAARSARVQILLALDERLSTFEDLRRKLNKTPQPVIDGKDKIELRRYIAVFERLGYALKLKEVPLKRVDHFYGDRFGNLVRYPHTISIVKNDEAWTDFYFLWKKLRRYKKNRWQFGLYKKNRWQFGLYKKNRWQIVSIQKAKEAADAAKEPTVADASAQASTSAEQSAHE